MMILHCFNKKVKNKCEIWVFNARRVDLHVPDADLPGKRRCPGRTKNGARSCAAKYRP